MMRIHPIRRSFSLDFIVDDSDTQFLHAIAEHNSDHNSDNSPNHQLTKSNSSGLSASEADTPVNMTTTAVHWNVDDIDDALAADFDGSLSGLGMELGTNSFNMSEALMALPTLKHEHSHHSVNIHSHHHNHHHSGHHSLHGHQSSRHTHSENSSLIDRKEDSSPLLHSNTDDINRPVAIVHGKKNRLTYGNEDEIVPTAIKRFCLNNERETYINHEHNKFLLANNSFLASEDECTVECANDIRCQHRHSSSVPDLRATPTLNTGQSHSTASSPSSSSTPTPTTSSVLSQILATQQSLSSPTSSPNHEVPKNKISSKFQYVLGAATSMAVKVHEETMTYLNQGQSYEIKLKKTGDLSEMRGKMLKTILRVGFQERRLQYMEKELIYQWKQQRPSERILEIDIPLSYGVHDIFNDPKDVNKCELFWDPTKETGVFVRVNCISTEFTPKKHGGEKGVPFRIVIETYPHNGNTPSSCLHAASCQVKVFKPKGADRKHKTDREKMSKKPQTEQEKFQSSYDCTVFIDCPLDSLFSFSNSNVTILPQSTSSPTITTITTTNSNKVETKHSALLLKEPPSKSKTLSSPIPDKEAIIDSANNSNTALPSSIIIKSISCDSDANETNKWLHSNRFGNYCQVFSNYSGADILRLTREDLIQICGLTDGIRLFNALNARSIRPRLTIYVCLHSDEVFRAVYLENLTVNELLIKLSVVLLGSNRFNFQRVCIYGPSGIRVLVTDDVVRNMCEESLYMVEITKDNVGDAIQALLKPYSN